MSSSPLDAIRRSLGFRLNLWYSLVFIASALLAFWAIYFLLAATLARKDREIVEARLKEYAALHDAGGVAAIRRSLMPVRVAIQSSVVSTTLARSSLVNTRSGRYPPHPFTTVLNTLTGSYS